MMFDQFRCHRRPITPKEPAARFAQFTRKVGVEILEEPGNARKRAAGQASRDGRAGEVIMLLCHEIEARVERFQ